jgi:hypothetical protein
MLFPMQPLKKNRYSYEHYREAWPLLRPCEKKQRPLGGKK